MAAVNEHQMHRPASPEASPRLAIGPCTEMTRCVSSASFMSHGSGTDVSSRHSLGSELCSRQFSGSQRSSRESDASNVSGQSAQSIENKARRRGYVRPQGTDFAASARSRESVMNLGSIAHLQYYFARTGLLDGKGGHFARKRARRQTPLDLALLEESSAAPYLAESDADLAYGASGDGPLEAKDSSPEAGVFVESPTEDVDEDEYEESFAETDPGMLPPTVSTYHQKEKPIPRPPTIGELKAELEACLLDAYQALEEVRARKVGTHQESWDVPELHNMPEENTQGWFELQGMHILDVVTLAIRAAKMYYTAHDMPDRLDLIKSERQIRSDLLGVMDVLQQMATRNFKGGMREDEINTQVAWVESVFDILRQEQEIEAAEQAERKSWVWLRGDWSGREHERERAFLMSMDPEAEPLPEWTPLSEATECPTPFLRSLQNGLRLVKLHNAAVKKSRRGFGAIPTFHVDTQKPYRCADNLRYWVKAAELRFEVRLKVDVLGVVYDSGREVWQDFEKAVLKWCGQVRAEIVSDLAT
ncbi:hypothetical protein AAL_00628 [Moelleriella libera RCEF 2490]|uniref:Uncharacterized protein n=1 Tax=Moelleriella libera RCEF 2490 TaxID=1081109 RepID=A0A166V0B8_9HYPO|nr:hypothetical protein AAL_00628 [Moelleriella libera RCEF 2490]